MSSPFPEKSWGYKMEGNVISGSVSQVSDSSLDSPEILESARSGGTRRGQSQGRDEEAGKRGLPCKCLRVILKIELSPSRRKRENREPLRSFSRINQLSTWPRGAAGGGKSQRKGRGCSQGTSHIGPRMPIAQRVNLQLPPDADPRISIN